MALRQEDFEIAASGTAQVYRFPVERAEVAQIRRGIASRRAARRRHRTGLAAVAVAVLALTLMGGGREAIAPAEGRGRSTVVVQPGETLWDVAERHAPEGSDLRVYVATLTDLNDLDGGLVQAGARLRLP